MRVSAAIENTSVTAVFNAAKAKVKDEKAAKNMERRKTILQNLKNMGQNTNANFIKEQNTQSLSNYLKTIQLQKYARDNEENGEYAENEEYVYENNNN